MNRRHSKMCKYDVLSLYVILVRPQKSQSSITYRRPLPTTMCQIPPPLTAVTPPSSPAPTRTTMVLGLILFVGATLPFDIRDAIARTVFVPFRTATSTSRMRIQSTITTTHCYDSLLSHQCEVYRTYSDSTPHFLRQIFRNIYVVIGKATSSILLIDNRKSTSTQGNEGQHVSRFMIKTYIQISSPQPPKHK